MVIGIAYIHDKPGLIRGEVQAFFRAAGLKIFLVTISHQRDAGYDFAPLGFPGGEFLHANKRGDKTNRLHKLNKQRKLRLFEFSHIFY